MALHICGNATRIVNDMVATHSPLLEVDYKVDLAQVKEGIRGKTAVMGTVDPSAVLALGTADQVREERARTSASSARAAASSCRRDAPSRTRRQTRTSPRSSRPPRPRGAT